MDQLLVFWSDQGLTDGRIGDVINNLINNYKKKFILGHFNKKIK